MAGLGGGCQNQRTESGSCINKTPTRGESPPGWALMIDYVVAVGVSPMMTAM